MFGELDQYSPAGLRVKERNPLSPGARHRRGVQETITPLGEPRERPVEVVDSKAEMVNSRTPPGEKLRDGRVFRSGLEQLDSRLSGRKKNRSHFLRRNDFTADLGH